MTQAFPLQWPAGLPRTAKRVDSAFQVHPTRAFDEMLDELARFKATGVVISSNIPTRRDGTPYRDGLVELLDDPGVAVYFTRGDRQVCLPCDTYRRPWENARAIGKAIEALRAMERHGARQILEQAFTGFTALPSPDAASSPADRAWHEVLGCSPAASTFEINIAWRERCRETGGATHELNAARDAGLAARDVGHA